MTNEEKYQVDRNEVNALSFNEANDHTGYWADKTEDERLNAACFIINQIFGVTSQTKIDRTLYR
jgi:hypothetical protein